MDLYLLIADHTWPFLNTSLFPIDKSIQKHLRKLRELAQIKHPNTVGDTRFICIYG